jgi:expansin (peptidoglycan-binding protein)
MGFFKSMKDLSQQANEINKNWDVGAQLADAQASMQNAQAMMAQQTAAANLAATGLDGVATITGVRQSGGMVNFQPILELDLTVAAAGRPPLPVTVSQPVEQIFLAKAQPGGKVAVKVDPADPNLVWINWAAPTPA